MPLRSRRSGASTRLADAPAFPLPPRQRRALRTALGELATYSRHLAVRPLRSYQLEPGELIRQAVLARRGGSFSVMMSRQAGKNELSAQLEAYLLTLHRSRGGSIVKAAPTFRPQVVTSMQRLKDVLDSPLAEIIPVEPEHGYSFRLGRSRAFFLSAEPTASVVGATASLMLEFDEAQDVDADKHDRDFVPMAAAHDAVRVYWGTASREDDLLQTVKRRHLELERRDGVRRHFEYPWSAVAEHNPAYGRFVESERARLGATHPVFLTQYELKAVAPLDALLDPHQLRLLQGDHPRLRAAEPDRIYVAGVDVAGPAELILDPMAPAHRADRDSTVIVIAEVDRSDSAYLLPLAPTYAPILSRRPRLKVVETIEWRGRSHQAQYRDLLQLLDVTWRCRAVAFDATGLGQAPAEFLQAYLGSRLIPVVFTQQRKSQLGYDLLAAVNADGLKHYAAGPDDAESRACWSQLRATRRTLQPGGLMSWAAPRGHDDHVSALALAVHAAGQAPPDNFLAMIPPVYDPLYDHDRW